MRLQVPRGSRPAKSSKRMDRRGYRDQFHAEQRQRGKIDRRPRQQQTDRERSRALAQLSFRSAKPLGGKT